MNGSTLTLSLVGALALAGAVRARGSTNAPSRTDFANLRPDDRLTLYHGTSLSESSHLLNGFDATTIKSRQYGGLGGPPSERAYPRHQAVLLPPGHNRNQHRAATALGAFHLT